MAYDKGRSGNPGGRPKKTQQQIDFEYKCRNWASLFAFDKLKKIANSKDVEHIKWATKELLDRGFGKSVETSIIDASIASESGISIKDLEREAAELLGEATGGLLAVPGEDQVDTGK